MEVRERSGRPSAGTGGFVKSSRSSGRGQEALPEVVLFPTTPPRRRPGLPSFPNLRESLPTIPAPLGGLPNPAWNSRQDSRPLPDLCKGLLNL